MPSTCHCVDAHIVPSSDLERCVTSPSIGRPHFHSPFAVSTTGTAALLELHR
ncbi:MAG: hypothetical protein QM765_05775 [Myxococcales bacterium]